jgi:hypothetical protein
MHVLFLALQSFKNKKNGNNIISWFSLIFERPSVGYAHRLRPFLNSLQCDIKIKMAHAALAE